MSASDTEGMFVSQPGNLIPFSMSLVFIYLFIFIFVVAAVVV